MAAKKPHDGDFFPPNGIPGDQFGGPPEFVFGDGSHPGEAALQKVLDILAERGPGSNGPGEHSHYHKALVNEGNAFDLEEGGDSDPGSTEDIWMS